MVNKSQSKSTRVNGVNESQLRSTRIEVHESQWNEECKGLSLV